MGVIGPGGPGAERRVGMVRNITRGDDAVAREEDRTQRRERRTAKAGIDYRSRSVVILIDDGLATGSTMMAAVKAVRQRNPARVIVAVPVGAPDTCEALSTVADEVVCMRTPEPFSAVGQWYLDFDQTSDEEVRQLLRAHARAATPHP